MANINVVIDEVAKLNPDLARQIQKYVKTHINVNIKMYIFDHLKMYKFAYSSSGFMYSFNRYDLPVILITCA